MVSAVVIVIIAFVLSVFFSGMEVAFASSNRLKLRIETEQGGFYGGIIGIFIGNPQRYITTLLAGKAIAIVLYTLGMSAVFDALAADLGLEVRGIAGMLVLALISAVIMIAALEFIPKVMFGSDPDLIFRIFLIPLFIFYVILFPFAMFAAWLAVGILRLFGAKVHPAHYMQGFDRVDLAQMLEEAVSNEPESEEEEQEIRLFRNALDFSDLKVRDCMIPRVDIEAIDVNAAIGELAAKFIDTNYSRIFIFDGSVDNIIGYVNTKSMFRMPATIREVLMEVDYVPESLSAQKLLSMFTKKKHAVAVVVDEFGGTAGMVSMEDVLEEIFGEIEDEHDENDLVEKPVGDNSYVLSCRLEIDYLNEKYGLGIPESEEYDTLAGYIIYYYEGIPSQGEIVNIDNKEIKILRMSGSKLELARVRIL